MTSFESQSRSLIKMEVAFMEKNNMKVTNLATNIRHIMNIQNDMFKDRLRDFLYYLFY